MDLNVLDHIDDLLIITKFDWSDQLNKLEQVLQKHKYNGPKYNIEKSFFGKTQMEYLGFWVTRSGIRPVKKVEARVNMTPPKNIRQVNAIVGLVNYHKYMWDRRSYLIQPLTPLMSTKVKFKWTDVE